MKKRYEKPTCKVILLHHQSPLLTTSDPDRWGKAPAITPDDHHLA